MIHRAPSSVYLHKRLPGTRQEVTTREVLPQQHTVLHDSQPTRNQILYFAGQKKLPSIEN